MGAIASGAIGAGIGGLIQGESFDALKRRPWGHNCGYSLWRFGRFRFDWNRANTWSRLFDRF